MPSAALLAVIVISLCSCCTALVTGTWTVGSAGLELRISITAEKGAWDAEVLLAGETPVADLSGHPWSVSEPVRVSVSLPEPIGEVWPLIPYGGPVRNAYEVWSDATSFECTAAQSATDKVCCGTIGALVVKSLQRNNTLYQPYKIGSYSQHVVTGKARVQVTQGTQVSSIDIGIGQAVNGPFLLATFNLPVVDSTSIGTFSDSLLVMGSDGSTFWAPSAAFALTANHIGITDANWHTAASNCIGSATSLTTTNSTDQWELFRPDTLSSVCPAAEAVATIEDTATSAKSVRFEGCAGQSTAVVLLRLDACAFTLVRRFAAPVITDAGLIVGSASPSNGGIIFVDVANKGSEGVVSVALSLCCGAGGACEGYTSNDPVSHALGTAEAVRFKLAFLVVGGRGNGAYCIAELWQAGKKEGSVRVSLTEESDVAIHAPDGNGPIWNGPVSVPGLILPNNTCDLVSLACGCGGSIYATGECIVPSNSTFTDTSLLCGEHGKPVPDEWRCECESGWTTIADQPAVHYLWCTQVVSPVDENLKHYNTSPARLFILAPILLMLCCCCCCGYICTSLFCKVRRCCRRRKRRAQKKAAKKEDKMERKKRRKERKERESKMLEINSVAEPWPI